MPRFFLFARRRRRRRRHDIVDENANGCASAVDGFGFFTRMDERAMTNATRRQDGNFVRNKEGRGGRQEGS